MISSLAELNRVKDDYYRWKYGCGGGRDSEDRADTIAADNFVWVLDQAIALTEKAENG